MGPSNEPMRIPGISVATNAQSTCTRNARYVMTLIASGSINATRLVPTTRYMGNSSTLARNGVARNPPPTPKSEQTSEMPNPPHGRRPGIEVKIFASETDTDPGPRPIERARSVVDAKARESGCAHLFADELGCFVSPTMADALHRRLCPGFVKDPCRDERDENAECRSICGHVREVGLREPRPANRTQRRAYSVNQGDAPYQSSLTMIEGYRYQAARKFENLVHHLDHVGIADAENRNMADPDQNPSTTTSHGHQKTCHHAPDKGEQEMCHGSPSLALLQHRRADTPLPSD